jgi:hypothetical protein
VDAILKADTSILNDENGNPIMDPQTGKPMANFVDQQTGERLRVTEGRKAAVLDTIVQAAYGYNTPAETAEVLRNKLAELETDPGMMQAVRDARARIVREPGAIEGGLRQPRQPEDQGGPTPGF